MATLEQLAEGIRRAHAAGDTENVRILGQAYRQMQGLSESGVVRRSPQEWADAENLPIPGTDWRTPDPIETYKSPVPGFDFMNEVSTSFGENLPVVGPLVTNAADAVGSNLAASLYGGTPEEARQRAEMIRTQQMRGQPVANAIGNVMGAVGPLMRIAQTQTGGKALGVTGPVPQRIAFGAASGGAIAGADAAARGYSPEQIAEQTLMGVGVGAGGPLAERYAIQPLARMFAGQSVPVHIRALDTNLQRAGIDPASIPQRMAAEGPDAMLLDLNPNLTKQGAAIASLPGEGQTILTRALEARQQGANARIQGDVNAVLGPSPTPSYVQRTIREGQQALQPAYREVLKGSAPVDTSAVAKSLDDIISDRVGPGQRAAQQIRNWLDEADNPGVLSQDPARLLSVRNAIDGLFEGEANPQVIAVLSEARRAVDDILAEAVPGIKQIDSQFEELARQSTGLRQGANALDSGKAAIRPTELEDMVEKGVQPQGLFIGPSGETFRVSQGARAEIDRLIGTTANDLNALKTALKGDGSWNRSRLVSLYGQDTADRLLDILEREQRFANSFNTVLRNSETAARTAAQKEAAPTTFNIEMGKLLTGGPQFLANQAARARSESVNKQLAEILMSNPTPEVVDQLISARRLGQALIGSSATPLLVNGP